MKVKRLAYIALFSIFLFGETESVLAEDMVFPYPKGSIYITNGYDGSTTHKNKSFYSIDMRTYEKEDPCDSYGAPILAARSGTVFKTKNADEDGAYGTHIIMKNSDGTNTWYAHMIKDTLAVSINDQVVQGQILGLMGDTGNTAGMKCSAFDGENIGAHLHYEMRDANGSAYKPEPMIGEERYTGLSKAGNPYLSTTIMVDPTNHWDLYNGKVPYRLSYNPAQIDSIHPLMVIAGNRATFSVKGTSLPDDMEISIAACSDMRWENRTASEQIFSCQVENSLSGEQISATGFTSQTYGAIPFEFTLNILAAGSDIPSAQVSSVDFDNKRPGELKMFAIRGKNLPGDLIFNFPECSDQDFISRTPNLQIVKCRVPRRIEASDGKRINGLHTFSVRISDPRETFHFETTYQEDYRIAISKLTPLQGAYGVPNTFTFRGKNVDLADAFFIERCGDLREISRSQNSVKIQCIPLIRESFLNDFIPSFLHQRIHYFVVKDKPAGEKLMEGNILMQLSDKIYISDVVPDRPLLLENNEFEITGAHLPETLLVWIPNCEGMKVSPKNAVTETIHFTCAPQLQNGVSKKDLDGLDQKMTRLMGPLAQMPDLTEYEAFFEKQKRIAEVKLPKNISDIEKDDKALLIFKKDLSPISELYQKALDQLKEYFPKDIGGTNETLGNEDVMDYVKKANGKYSEEFLKSVGWRKLTNQEYQSTLSEVKKDYAINHEDVINIENYDLIDCPERLMNVAVEHQLFDRILRLPVTFWINTFGKCSNGLLHIIPSHMFTTMDNNEPVIPLAYQEYQNKINSFSDGMIESKITQESIPAEAEIHFDEENGKITAQDKSELAKNGFQLIDNTYEWFLGTSIAFSSSKTINAMSKYSVEPIDCRISEEEQETINEYLKIDKNKEIERIWASSLPLEIKFYLQNALDFATIQSKKISDVINEKRFSCKGFWFEYTGLYTAKKILSTAYNKDIVLESIEYYLSDK